MSPDVAVQSAPWEALLVCAVLLFAPSLASQRATPAWQLLGLAVALVAALFASTATLAYAAVAAGALIHALGAWPRSRTGPSSLPCRRWPPSVPPRRWLEIT